MTDKDYTHVGKKYDDLDEDTINRLDKFFTEQQKGYEPNHALHQFFQQKKDKLKNVLAGRTPKPEEPKIESPKTESPKIDIPKPDPSSPNYREVVRSAIIESRIKAETAFWKKAWDQGVASEQQYNSAVAKLEQQRTKLDEHKIRDAELGLPHIPMGKNTHTKSKDGFVYGSTKISVQPFLKEDDLSKIKLEVVAGIWNTLPDEVRDKVKTLKIQASRGARPTRGGSYDDSTGTLIINIRGNGSHDSLMHTVQHEFGHVMWHGMEKSNPEKVQKFIERQKKIGVAPTEYSQSYVLFKEKNADRERRYRTEMKRQGAVLSARAEQILEYNRKAAEFLYQNEIHSELNAYAMGQLPATSIIVTKEKMKDLLDAYKEMWAL